MCDVTSMVMMRNHISSFLSVTRIKRIQRPEKNKKNLQEGI